MTNLLIKIFIKDKDNINDKNVREKYGMLSSITGIIINILLIYCILYKTIQVSWGKKYDKRQNIDN